MRWGGGDRRIAFEFYIGLLSVTEEALTLVKAAYAGLILCEFRRRGITEATYGQAMSDSWGPWTPAP